MGIANPRPAMRHREERNIHAKLAHHAAMLKLILNAADGHIDPALASSEASRLTKTRKARKTIWSKRDWMTTEELANKAIKDIRAMSADERATLRELLSREFGPTKKIAGFADAAHKVACEEAAMAQPPITDKIQ